MMNTQMEIVPPEHLRDVWELVRPGLLRASAHAKILWIPEEVFAACLTKQMFMYVWFVDGQYAAVAVLQKRMVLGRQTLQVFAGYAEPAYYSEVPTMNQQVDELARGIGASKITFQSPRKGWGRRAAQLGFSPECVIYSKEL
jgi:hypothetical protein